MPRYMADVIDRINWQVEFDAPDGLSAEELKTHALNAWRDMDGETSIAMHRYDEQDVTTIIKLPE